MTTDESRRVPVFPLPDVTLFPHALLPLHVFEARYVAMTRAALSGEGLIAMAMLKPGYESCYFTNHAPIHPVVGIGKILGHRVYEDGRFDLLLEGRHRARVIGEVPGGPFRVAELAVLAASEATPAAVSAAWREQVRLLLEADCGLTDCTRIEVERVLRTEASLDQLTDQVAAHLPLSADQRQELLGQTCPQSRARDLLARLEELRAGARCRASRRWQSAADRN